MNLIALQEQSLMLLFRIAAPLQKHARLCKTAASLRQLACVMQNACTEADMMLKITGEHVLARLQNGCQPR